MQARMKQHQLSKEQITALLDAEQVGHLAMSGFDGYPYVVPVHYIFMDGRIYIHGLAAGEKLKNIQKNPHVCFEIAKMISLIHDENPCDTNTRYESVIIKGNAELIDRNDKKKSVLMAIVAKYTPQHIGKIFPDSMLKMTSVIEIVPDLCTGKYYC
jgi:nitroimidazol reductase NimA-like FMN-containing flavoprotein (pyridoxamine 5'-phosphate oxidase superfamily)